MNRFLIIKPLLLPLIRSTMQTTSPTEYLYQDARTSHHHAYLIKPLLDLLEQAIAIPSSDKN